VCATLLLQNRNKYSSSSCCTCTVTGLQWLADEQVEERTNHPAATAQCDVLPCCCRTETNTPARVVALVLPLGYNG